MRNVIERILNLLAFLLTVGRPVTADEIRRTVAGYDQESDQAFARMFERDKELLRSLGIPIRLTPTDAWEVEHGYEVAPSEYRLRDPGLTDEERTALWLAAQAVRFGGHQAAPEAILKLGGARTTTGLEPFSADLGEGSGSLVELFSAAAERRLVRFTYRGRTREVAPHGVGHRRGHWYLVGTTSEDEMRVFRVDRMEDVAPGDRPNAFEPRPDVDIRAELDTQPWEAGEEAPRTVTVRFDPDVAWWAVRRLGRSPDAVERLPGGAVEVELAVSHVEAFIGWVLSFGAGAEVLAPDEVRARVVDRIAGRA